MEGEKRDQRERTNEGRGERMQDSLLEGCMHVSYCSL